MKLQFFIASLAILLWSGTAQACPDFAEKHHSKMGMAKVFSEMEPEKKEAWTKLHDQLIKDAQKLKDELKAKKMEYRALKNNTQVSPFHIRELTERIVELERILEQMNDDFIKKSKNEFNLDFENFKPKHSDNHNPKDYQHKRPDDHKTDDQNTFQRRK